ncbi:MAG: TonB-dependent receptor [FCB group bacterium]|jgi:outer membrane receptor protein involved in Fe transport
MEKKYKNTSSIIIILLLSSVINLFLTDKLYCVPDPPVPPSNVDYSVYVFDTADSTPILSAKVVLKKDGVTGAYMFTNASGKVFVRNVVPGKYILNVSFKEYKDFSDTVVIDNEHSSTSIGLITTIGETKTEPITVTAYRILDISSIQVNTGYQLFDVETNHSSPTIRMSDLLQENVLGAAKAPTGEIHIRGMHGELTYYLDDIPVPLGVFGGLNEIVDTKAIERMTMVTGGFPAEYGGQMAAIMDIQTIVPSGHSHIDFSTYAGSYFVLNGTKPFSPGNQVPAGASSSIIGDTLGGRVGPFRAINSNGQTLSLSNHIGQLGYFLSASRQETDRRVDSPTPVLYNDHGTDYFLYGKFDYLLTPKDYVTMNLNYSKTNNQVPFNLSLQGLSPDNQSSYNAFQTLSYYHTYSGEQSSEKTLFIGLFARQGGLNYNPSSVSPVNFQFAGDSIDYALTENRQFNTLGMRTKFDHWLSKQFKYTFGLNLSETTGTENFSSRDSLGEPGPNPSTNFSGSDFGLFTEEEYQPFDWFRLDAGVRYDQHIAPDVSLQNQFSPRIKLNFFIDEQNTFYLYYGRLFMPTNVEGLRLIASNITNTGEPTLPERDDFYEATYLHTFDFGLIIKAAVFHKFSSPGLDDQTIGSSSVKTAVNIENVRTTGIELGISYTHPTVPISGFLNAALNHAYGSGAITGGFLPLTSDGAATDLDHDQRLSLVAELNWQPKDWFVNLTGIYGSGLTNGNPGNYQYSTGILCFNTFAHVSPYTVFNLSGGFTIHFSGETTIEPSIYINNLFDNNYLLKGVYFSGANWGDRRNVVLKVAVHI